MAGISFYIPELTPALTCASVVLQEKGHNILREPDKSAAYMLLPIPSKNFEKYIPIAQEFGMTIIGGNLPVFPEIASWDLLKDPEYLTKNASITADCTVTILRQKLPCSLAHCRVLIIGWGRIGKMLSRQLSLFCPDITVCTGSPEKEALCKALGYSVVDYDRLSELLPVFRVVVNTAPMHQAVETDQCRETAVILDLASVQGLSGEQVNWARGLPGKMEPEENGRLIAETVIRYLK